MAQHYLAQRVFRQRSRIRRIFNKHLLAVRLASGRQGPLHQAARDSGLLPYLPTFCPGIPLHAMPGPGVQASDPSAWPGDTGIRDAVVTETGSTPSTPALRGQPAPAVRRFDRGQQRAAPASETPQPIHAPVPKPSGSTPPGQVGAPVHAAEPIDQSDPEVGDPAPGDAIEPQDQHASDVRPARDRTDLSAAADALQPDESRSAVQQGSARVNAEQRARVEEEPVENRAPFAFPATGHGEEHDPASRAAPSPSPTVNPDDLFAPRDASTRTPQVWAERLFAPLGTSPDTTTASADLHTAPARSPSRPTTEPVHQSPPPEASTTPTAPVQPGRRGPITSAAPSVDRPGTPEMAHPPVPMPAHSAELFAPRDPLQRTPQVWAQRLFAVESGDRQAGAPDPGLAPRETPVRSGQQVGVAEPTATPLPESTRRFLRPLLGIDPAHVRIHHGPAVDRVTAAAHADALAVGDSILLRSGHPEREPETIGLLAHELTHIARTHTPRFVPPIVRDSTATAHPMHSNVRAAPDEETVAQIAETSVRQAAREQRYVTSDEDTLDEPRPTALDPSAEPQPVSRQTQTGRSWNGVPAPWEALPDWLAAPASAPAGPQTPQPDPVTSPLPTTAPVVQAAARDRQRTEKPAPVHTSPETSRHAEDSPEMDLDALARDVYKIVRRRLAAEVRRAER